MDRTCPTLRITRITQVDKCFSELLPTRVQIDVQVTTQLLRGVGVLLIGPLTGPWARVDSDQRTEIGYPEWSPSGESSRDGAEIPLLRK